MRLKSCKMEHGLNPPAVEDSAVHEPREAKLVQPAQLAKSTHFGNGGLSLTLFFLQGVERVWVGKPFWAKAAIKLASRCALINNAYWDHVSSCFYSWLDG